MEKPPILSDEQIRFLRDATNTQESKLLLGNTTILCERAIVQVQYDALVAYYEPLIQQVAREIFEEFLEHGIEVLLHGEKWYEVLKSKYTGGQ
jgi:hypothetical protein